MHKGDSNVDHPFRLGRGLQIDSEITRRRPGNISKLSEFLSIFNTKNAQMRRVHSFCKMLTHVGQRRMPVMGKTKRIAIDRRMHQGGEHFVCDVSYSAELRGLCGKDGPTLRHTHNAQAFNRELRQLSGTESLVRLYLNDGARTHFDRCWRWARCFFRSNGADERIPRRMMYSRVHRAAYRDCEDIFSPGKRI